MSTIKTLEIEISPLRDGRYKLFTSINGRSGWAVGVTFPTIADAHEVASAIANATDADHTEITEVES